MHRNKRKQNYNSFLQEMQKLFKVRAMIPFPSRNTIIIFEASNREYAIHYFHLHCLRD